ncbi:sulfite exporter TauE/SafE family protein [Candidatus Woesearchaeota archaeon]|nr:sulfite exporter TauE/SafE family protein [Candidatus Woesearchaeota archaeon]
MVLELGIAIFAIVVLAAIIMEMIDAGLGMGYGTVLSPLLLAFGYAPTTVVPAVLISQAIGGGTAAIFHHRYRNVDFKPKSTNIKRISNALRKYGVVECVRKGFSNDLKIVLAITILGLIATVFGALVALNIPKWALNGYIGALVMIIGLIMIFKKSFKFSWKKMMGVGLLASFNKGISGGGFGPVTTGGQIIAGNHHKSAIGCTTLAEAPICIAGFITYLIFNGLQGYGLVIALCIGAVIGAPIGALFTRKLNSPKIKYVLGMIILLLGAWTIIKLLM